MNETGERRSGSEDPAVQTCPLCGGTSRHLFRQREPDRELDRPYYRCSSCEVVHVPSTFFLPPEEEKARYDEHMNDPDDPNYRDFLARLFDPMVKALEFEGGSTMFRKGLDFGSGPGPTLSRMFNERGYDVSLYDPFYAPHESHLQRSWDFITTTETVEHLHAPLMEMDRLWTCLKPGGWLGIMTSTVPADFDFASWHYKNDPTHVVFWTESAFEWLADRWDAELKTFPEGVFLFRKRTG